MVFSLKFITFFESLSSLKTLSKACFFNFYSETLELPHAISNEDVNNMYNTYGIENFKKEIIAECSSFEEMNELEKELVNHEFVQNPNTYNHSIGGSYGWKNCLKYKSEEEIYAIRKNASDAIINLMKDPEYRKQHAEKISIRLKQYWKENGHNWEGKTHSEETKRKMSNAKKGHKGKTSPNKGKTWKLVDGKRVWIDK